MRPNWLIVLSCLALSGCWPSGQQPEVVVYAALDSEFSQPILEDFERETGIVVRPKFDVESTKTVGLREAIRAEAARPRCDVFWNNEILNTLLLEREGLLDVYRSPAAESYPEMYRSADGTWHGFAGRARVLIVNTELVAEEDRPDSIHDLADPKWRGKVAIAKPLFGTTASHAACLFAQWGPEKAKEYFQSLKSNKVQVLSGNKQVAVATAAGQVAFGLTDTDDAIIEIESGRPVAIVYPDRQSDQLGTLFIPNTLAIIKGCPHPAEARKLVDYLLAPAVEEKLARAESAQFPLNPAVKVKSRVESTQPVKAMPVDFAEAARHWDAAAAFIRDEFTRE